MKTVFTLAGMLLVSLLSAQSVAGPNSAGAAANNAGTGSVAWTNTANIYSSDNSYSTTSVSVGVLGSANTNYLVASGFGFSLPGTAVVTGIKVELEKQYDILVGLLSSVSDNEIKLVKGGVIGGTNRAAGGGWPANDAYSSYGGSADLWGRTWSAADINNSNFGVAVSATVSAGLVALTMNTLVDHIRITVYFNVPVPVKLIHFQGDQSGETVKLKWETVSESSSSFFYAEKLNEKTGNWITVDSVPAAGQSNEFRQYAVIDRFPEPHNIYRLRETDQDGKESYSTTIQVPFHSMNKADISFYPMPAQEYVNIHSSLPMKSIALKNIRGRCLVYKNLTGIETRYLFSFGDIPNGIYSLLIETTGSSQVQMLVVEK